MFLPGLNVSYSGLGAVEFIMIYISGLDFAPSEKMTQFGAKLEKLGRTLSSEYALSSGVYRPDLNL